MGGRRPGFLFHGRQAAVRMDQGVVQMNLLHKNVYGAVFALLIALPVAYAFSNRSPPITVLEGRVEPQQIAAGDCGDIKWTVQIHRVCPLSMDRRIETERGNVWPLAGKFVEGYATKNQKLDITHEFCLPHSIRTADAIYRQTTYYHCWPWDTWWPIVINMPPVSFHIKGQD